MRGDFQGVRVIRVTRGRCRRHQFGRTTEENRYQFMQQVVIAVDGLQSDRPVDDFLSYNSDNLSAISESRIGLQR